MSHGLRRGAGTGTGRRPCPTSPGHRSPKGPALAAGPPLPPPRAPHPAHGDGGPSKGPPSENRSPQEVYAAFALLAYMSTYSCPDSRITSAITESVTARRT